MSFPFRVDGIVRQPAVVTTCGYVLPPFLPQTVTVKSLSDDGVQFIGELVSVVRGGGVLSSTHQLDQ